MVDPHRPGHESRYYPGETNVRHADVFVINKVDTAAPENVMAVRSNIQALNPNALIIEGASPLFVDNPDEIRGKRVLVIEDGPTLTHGEMAYGAGWVAARRFGAAEIVDPRPFAVGSIITTYEKYPTTGQILPAMGYGEQQMRDLEATINRADVDLVAGTPMIDPRDQGQAHAARALRAAETAADGRDPHQKVRAEEISLVFDADGTGQPVPLCLKVAEYKQNQQKVPRGRYD